MNVSDLAGLYYLITSLVIGGIVIGLILGLKRFGKKVILPFLFGSVAFVVVVEILLVFGRY